ncbi:hypothetical protein, partial [Bowmanella yangjiangensis]
GRLCPSPESPGSAALFVERRALIKLCRQQCSACAKSPEPLLSGVSEQGGGPPHGAGALFQRRMR